jgi:site-specific recombinase XerD
MGRVTRKRGDGTGETGDSAVTAPVEHDEEGFFRHMMAIRRPATARAYQKATRKLLSFLEESDIEIGSASPGVLGEFVSWMSRQKFEPATVRLFAIGARRYLEWLRDQGQDVPEVKSAEVPQIPDREVRVLDGPEIARFLTEVYKHILEPCRTALMLLPYTGLRANEMCSLRLDQLKSGKDTAGKSHVYFHIQGKGQKMRDVPLPKQGKKILIDFLNGWRAEYTKSNKQTPYVFPGNIGKHLADNTLRDNLAHVRNRLGMPYLIPHVLRKTYSTELLKQGFPIERVSRVMGHASIETTNKYYTKVKENEILDLGNARIGS